MASPAEFGIGMRSYGIGPNFRGVKMIPPGLHLVTYGTGMERVGVFLQFGAGGQHGRNFPASAACLATRRTTGPPACSGLSLRARQERPRCSDAEARLLYGSRP